MARLAWTRANRDLAKSEVTCGADQHAGPGNFSLSLKCSPFRLPTPRDRETNSESRFLGRGAMYRLSALVFGLLVAGSVAKAAEPVSPSPPPWSLVVATEARYFSWTSTRGVPIGVPPTQGHGSGSELYVPFAAQLVGKPSDDWKIELLGRGGWVWARQSTAGLTGEVETSTDTTASATATYLGINGIQPFASVNVNAPTGRSELFGSAANARMDSDLVDIASFGEGFNIGPTFGLNLPITTEWTVTTSAGYTYRGSYARENSLGATNSALPTDQTPIEIGPGDVLTFYAAVGYQADRLSNTLSGSISEERPTSENSEPLYKPGRRYLVTDTLSYNWPDIGLTTLTLSAAHSNRNEVVFVGTPGLIMEAMNTNSNLYRVGIQHLIPLGQFAVGPTGSFLYRDHNGYDSTTLQFVPAKTRWAAGGLARYAVNDAVTLNARVECVWTHENDRPAQDDVLFSVLANAFVPGSPIPAISSTGLQVAFGANVKF